jgi:hypothetical protein
MKGVLGIHLELDNSIGIMNMVFCDIVVLKIPVEKAMA